MRNYPPPPEILRYYFLGKNLQLNTLYVLVYVPPETKIINYIRNDLLIILRHFVAK